MHLKKLENLKSFTTGGTILCLLLLFVYILLLDFHHSKKGLLNSLSSYK